MEAVAFGKLIWLIILGLASGFLAKRKNRNPWGWGIAGALSFFIALIILAFLPYKCPNCNQSLTNKQGREKSCSSCGSFSSGVTKFAIGLSHPSNPAQSRQSAQPVKQVPISPADEEAIYERVAQEIESSNLRQGVWAKIISETDGDEKIAKARYIKVRSQELIDKKKQELQIDHELMLANVEEAMQTNPEVQKKIYDEMPKGKCPNCSKVVLISTSKCPSCGENFSALGSRRPLRFQ